jgi:hypothetical protein
MVFHMKTTLNIDDRVMAQLKSEAARQGRTMSELVETALRGLFRSKRSKVGSDRRRYQRAGVRGR